MATKPYADQLGHYRSRETSDGWFVLLDYALRLSKGGAPLQHPPTPDGPRTVNLDPWVIWHPASNTFVGFSNRKAATLALGDLMKGVDSQGLLSLLRGAPVNPGTCKQLPTHSRTEELTEVSFASPARARAQDYPTEFNGALATSFPPQLLMERLEDAMCACSPFASNGKTDYRPDWTARIKAIECAASYLIGRPIERQQILQANAPMSWESIVGLAKSSPVFRDTLMNMLEEMKAAAPKRASEG